METNLSESFGYRVLQGFLTELSIEFSETDYGYTKYCHNDILEADILWNVPQQPFELNPEENYEKVIHVGDIHGDFRSLYTTLLVFFKESLLNNKIAIVFTGDYVDRGLDSMLCLLLVAKFIKAGVKNMFFLRGNHETNSVGVFLFEKDGELSEMTAKDFIKRLPTVLCLTINGRKTMFTHGTPMVDEELPKNFSFNPPFKQCTLETTKEQMNKDLENLIDVFNRYISETGDVFGELSKMSLGELDMLYQYEDNVKSFIKTFKNKPLETIQDKSFENGNEDCLKIIEEIMDVRNDYGLALKILYKKFDWSSPVSDAIHDIDKGLDKMMEDIKACMRHIYMNSRGLPKPIPREMTSGLYNSSELLWGDVSDSYGTDIVTKSTRDGRQKVPQKLIDEYMLKNGLSIIFRGHQCPENDGWDVYINQNLVKDLVEQSSEDPTSKYDMSIFQEIPVIHNIRKVFTINLKETDRMISTIHTTMCYDDIAPRTFLMTDGLKTEAFRIESK